MCSLKEETLNHWMTCESHERKEIICDEIFEKERKKRIAWYDDDDVMGVYFKDLCTTVNSSVQICLFYCKNMTE